MKVKAYLNSCYSKEGEKMTKTIKISMNAFQKLKKLAEVEETTMKNILIKIADNYNERRF